MALKDIPIVGNKIRCDCCWHTFPREDMVSWDFTKQPQTTRSIISGYMCKDAAGCIKRMWQEIG